MSEERKLSKAEKRYAKQVEKLHVKRVTMTAAKAEEYLKANKNNRPYSRSNAKSLSESMLLGTFDVTGQMNVIKDWNDNQNNGQHTLNAIIMAQKEFEKNPELYPEWKGAKEIAIPLFICEGTDPSTANKIDIGKPRSAGDVIYRARMIKGQKTSDALRKKLSRWLAGAGRLVWARANGDIATTRKKFGTEAVVEYISENHPSLVDAVMGMYEIDTNDNDKNLIGRWCSPQYACGLFYLFATRVLAKDRTEISDKQWDKAAEFFRQFASGQGQPNEPAIRARKKFEDMSGKTKDRETVCNILCHCFIAYDEGREVDAAALNRALKSAETAKQPIRVGGYDVARPEKESITGVPEVSEAGEIKDLTDDAAAA